MYKKYSLPFFLLFLLSPLIANSLTQRWQFDIATNNWTNTTTADIWTLSAYTFTKSGGSQTPSGGFSEVWTYNPSTTRWTEISAGSNTWAATGVGTWHEYTSGTTWHYFGPSLGCPRGTWRHNGTGALWHYSEVDQTWQEEGTANTKYFPPFLPEQVIVQHQEILSAYNYLTTRKIPDGTTNIAWEDDFEALVYDYTTGAWTWTAPEYEPTGNAISQWRDNVTFTGGSPAYSEKWSLSENANTSYGRDYTNESATVIGGEVIHHNTATNTWTHNGADSHAWSFDPALNEWVNQGTGARYEYNTRARSWHQVDKALPLQTWQYKHDATDDWVWHDTINDVHWQYRSGDWENLATNDVYSASGVKLDDGADTWSYDPVAWQNDNSVATAALFPLLPPNPAGQLGRIQQQGYILGQSHVTTGSGFLTTYEGQQSDFDAATALRGSARAIAVNALTTPVTNLINLITPWQTKYLQLSNPHHHASHVFTPSQNGQFDIWNHVGWRFAQAGKAAVLFQAKGASQLTFSFATTPGTVLYTVIAQTGTNTVTISDSGGQIASTSITPFIADGSTWYDYWITYENGVITLGTGTMVKVNTVYTLDLTDSSLSLADDGNLSSIFYIGFTAQSGVPIEYRNIRTQPLDPTIALHGATNISTRIADEVAIGGWQDDFDDWDDEMLAVSTKLTVADRVAQLSGVPAGLATARTEITAAKTATDVEGYGEDGALDSVLSRSSFDAVFTQIESSVLLANAYNATQALLNSIDDDVTALLNKLDRNALSLNDFTTQVLATKTSLTTTLASLVSQLTIAKNEAVKLKAVSNAYTDLAHSMIEELGLAVALQTNLNYFEKYMILQHHELNFNLTTAPTTEQRNNLLAAIDAAEEEEIAAQNSMAQMIADGSLTVFGAACAPTTLLVRHSHDEIRTRIENTLSENADRHLIVPGSSHAYATLATNKAVFSAAQTTTQVALEGEPVELVVTSNPGTDKPVRPAIDEIVVELSRDAAATGTIAQQQVTATAGTKETPKNIVFIEHARVEEVVVNTTDKTDANVQIYAKDATVGLGRANLTKDAGKAVTVLGSSQFIPDGEGVVYVYSDMRVTPNDPTVSQVATPIAAGPNFGKATTDARCVGSFPLAEKGRHKIEFRAPGEQQTIIVGRNVELDLTNFGKGDTAGGQRIVFGKDVSLVLEPGAIIRFPYLEPSHAEKAPVLEFSGDNSRLIFKEEENRTPARHTDTKTGTDLIRNKILGTGVIRFSGTDARMEIHRGALVGVEADYQSPRTDLKFEFTGENARLELGTKATRGGALQIGNFQDGGYNRYHTDDYPNNSSNPDVGFEKRTTQIDCSFTINGLNAHIDICREGFLGLGVGVVNKQGLINGSTATKDDAPANDTWQTIPLYNVGSLKLEILEGYLDHSGMYFGNERGAGLLAIGPQIDGAQLKFTMNKGLPFPIKPGGYVLYHGYRAENETDEQSPVSLHLWDAAKTSVNNDVTDNGIYSLLAPPQTIFTRGVNAATGAGQRYGSGSVTNNSSSYSFLGNTRDFYRLLSMQDFLSDKKHVPAIKVSGNIKIGHVASNTIKMKNVLIDDVLTPGEGYQVPFEVAVYNNVLTGRDGNTPSRRWTQN